MMEVRIKVTLEGVIFIRRGTWEFYVASEMSSILNLVVVTYVKNHQVVHLRLVYFVCFIYVNSY